MIGAAIIPLGVGLLSFAVSNHNAPQIHGFLALLGAGFGLTFGPTSLQAQYSSPAELSAIVTTLNVFVECLNSFYRHATL